MRNRYFTMLLFLYYVGTVFLLVAQLDFDGPMKETLQRMAALFLLLFYVVAWLRAPDAADTPASTLNLYHRLVQYRQ